jgi:PAS domain S-box-containing protein
MTDPLSQLPEPKSPEDLASAFNLSIQLTDELLKVQDRLEKRLTAMETELAAANRFLHNILSSMHSGLIAVDIEERVIAFNAAAEKILGIPATETFGKPYSEIVREKDIGKPTGKFRGNASPAPVTIRQALKGGSLFLNIERELLRPDGSAVGVSSSLSALKDDAGHIMGAVEIFKDLSEVRRLEERLERADRLAMIGQMSATVAHEIRNPLNGIEGFASLLEREFAGDEPRRRYARNILEGVRALNKTVTDLLQFARPTRLNLRPTRLSQLFEQALLFLREEIRNPKRDGRSQPISPDIAIQTDYASAVDEIVADAEQLRGTFLNFLKNAAQAMPDGGHIHITTGPAENPAYVLIRIADTGIGIVPEIREKLFTPFVTTKEHGTGLGLALAKKIIESHQGTIDIESEPGKGATIILRLPRDPRAQ